MGLLVDADVLLRHGQILLEQALAQAQPTRWIYFYVCALVSSYILLNYGGRSIVLGMIPMVIDTIDIGCPIAWGRLVLAELYKELHNIMYHPGQRFGYITLL